MRRLLIRPGAIGDCILSLPALESLRASYTEVWAPEAVLPLFRFADRTSSIVSTGLNLLELPDVALPERLLERLRSFDSIISWYGSNRAEFIERVTALRLPFRFFPALPPPDGGIHAVDFFLRHALEAGGQPLPPFPRIDCPPRERAFAVIHPFSGSQKKNWPLERYRQLAERLKPKLPVQWLAGPEDPLDGATRIDDLYELACNLAGARIYIGNDSGITHLAAAAGTPVIALFGPTDPATWAPRGPRVRMIRGDSMNNISVDEVLCAVLTEIRQPTE